MQLYVGCSGFYNRDWKGVFYPEGLPYSKWFEFYCTRFNTLELNTTFYRFPRVSTLQKWYSRCPEQFRFAVKAPRLITHYKQMKDCESLLADFYGAVQEGLRERLGPVLFQFPARVPYSEEFLQRITQSLNPSFANVVEFRSATWWNQHVLSQLAQYGASFSGISIQNLPDEIIANTQLLYYRFHGIPKLYYSAYTKKRVQGFWTELRGTPAVDTAYVFFNNTATVAAINNATELQRLSNR